jgi:hypothetical protein
MVNGEGYSDRTHADIDTIVISMQQPAMHTLRYIIPLLLIATACGGSGGLFDSGPDIRGTVGDILLTPDVPDSRAFVRVEGEKHPDTRYKIADVVVTSQTSIYRRAGENRVVVPLDSLRKGQQVEVYFSGDVSGEIPVQAKAGEITIIGPAK